MKLLFLALLVIIVALLSVLLKASICDTVIYVATVTVGCMAAWVDWRK